MHFTLCSIHDLFTFSKYLQIVRKINKYRLRFSAYRKWEFGIWCTVFGLNKYWSRSRYQNIESLFSTSINWILDTLFMIHKFWTEKRWDMLKYSSFKSFLLKDLLQFVKVQSWIAEKRHLYVDFKLSEKCFD